MPSCTLSLAACALQNKNEGPHGDYEDSFDQSRHEARANVEKTKHHASNAVDDFKHQAEKAKHKVADIIPEPVKNTADKVSDKAHQAKVKVSFSSCLVLTVHMFAPACALWLNCCCRSHCTTFCAAQ